MKSVNKRQFCKTKKEVKVVKESAKISLKQATPSAIDKICEDEANEKNKYSKTNVEHICRICLITRENLLSTLSETYKYLPKMYFSVTSIKVDKESGYAFKICEICKNDLTYFYDFKKKCIKSDFVFKKLIGEINTNIDDGPRCMTTALKMINDGNEMEQDEIEHEDVEYLDDTLDYDVNTEENSVFITRETETVQNKQKASSDTKRRRKLCKSQQNFNCTMCTKKFLKAQTLKAHIKSEHWANLSHSCGQCKKSFSSEHDLQLHLPIHSKTDVWTCIECQKQFNDRSQLKRHIERHMEVKRHACAACGKMFAELYSLRRHARVHTGEALHKPYACQLCDKRYRYRTLLRAHMAQHNGERPCACAACGKTFASERLLASHSLVHLEHKPHKCHYCDKTFRHESTRNTHHRTHTGERPHVCARCGNTFIQRSNLVRHMRVHTGEKPYTCSVCERKFGCGSSLKNHMSIHTGDKPFKCNVCNKRFARSNMRLHMAKHTGERPHACSACGKRFVRPWALREHSRLHTGEKPFECAKCNEKFGSKAQLMRHFKIHEKDRKPVNKGGTIQKQEIPNPSILPDTVFSDRTDSIECQDGTGDRSVLNDLSSDSKIIISDDMQLDVTEEVVLQDDDRIEFIHNSETSQYVHAGDENVGDNVKTKIRYIEMTENGPSISSALLEDGGIKLYQLDQTTHRLLYRSRTELTVRKVTSTKTNF